MTSAHDLVPISPRPELPFDERIGALERSFSGRLGYHAVHLESASELELRADELFSTASVIKVAVACAALGSCSEDSPRSTIRCSCPRAPAGFPEAVPQAARPRQAPFRDAMELDGTPSDNVATNAVIERCGGPEAVNASIERLGLEQTRLGGLVDFSRITHDLAGGMGVSTPREQTRLVTALARDEILSRDLCANLRGVLERQHFQDQLPRWLGWNPYAQYHGRKQVFRVGSKSGELDGIRADVGLVTHAERARSRLRCSRTARATGGRLSTSRVRSPSQNARRRSALVSWARHVALPQGP